MVLLVIDAQSGITNEKLGFFNRFISNVEKLISVARQNNVEVIYPHQQFSLLPTFPSLSPLLLNPVLTRPLSGGAPGPPRALASKKDPRHKDGGTWFLLM